MNNKANMLPKISIITPSYNQAKFLEETILSVIKQDYCNIEYIVIDGVSTDGSIEIIRKYADQITYWVSEPDSGQSNAINKGFNIASGEIIAWLNSDDLYIAGTIKTIAQFFIDDPALDLVYGDCVFIDAENNFLRYFYECEDFNMKRLCRNTNFIMQPTTFFRRSKLFEIGMLRNDLHYVMDWDLWCRFAKANAKVKYIKKVLAANREHTDTKTLRGGQARLKEIFWQNCRYMDGIWPHFFWGATGTYLCNEAKRYPLMKVPLYCLGYLVMALSLVKIIDRIKKIFHPVACYGFYQNSLYCQSGAQIFIPYYKAVKPRQISFLLKIKGHASATAKIKVEVNGEETEFLSLKKNVINRLCINLNPKRVSELFHVIIKLIGEKELIFEGMKFYFDSSVNFDYALEYSDYNNRGQ